MSEFRAAHPSFELQNPGQNVTPLFFVRCGARLYGPMLREEVIRDYDRIKKIGWSCASPDFVLFELSDEDLSRCGVEEQTYRHPESELNEVIESPIKFLVGPVGKLSSATSFDLLPDEELVR